MTLKKIKRIDAKATTYYTSLIIDNKWNEHNSGSACSCWNCGAHDHRLQKCEVTNNQDQIYANKNNWEEENDKNSGGGGNYERRKFEGGNRYNFPIKNCGTGLSSRYVESREIFQNLESLHTYLTTAK